MSTSPRLRIFVYAAVTVVLTLIFLIWLMQLWRADISIPFMYQGDSLLFHQMTKSMIDNGWCLHNSFLGAPKGMDLHDFPQPDMLHLVIVKFISCITHDYAVTMNLFYIITYPLTAILACYAFMKLGISQLLSFAGAILYAFIPYHYFKGQHHIYLAAYYLVPIAAMLIIRVMSGEIDFFNKTATEAQNESKRSAFQNIIIAFLVSCTGIYYSFFTCFFLILAGITRSFFVKKVSSLATSLLLVLVIFIGLCACLSPTFIYIIKNGYNSQATYRVLHDTHLYSLKLAKMLLPVPEHRVKVLSNMRNKYNRESSFIYRAPDPESDSSTLGLWASIGFILTITALIIGIEGRPTYTSLLPILRRLGSLNIAAILLSVSAGLSTFVAPFVNYRIRCYSRISIFIAFFSLYALMLLCDRLIALYLKSCWVIPRKICNKNIKLQIGSAVSVLFALGIVVTGVYDQSSWRIVPKYELVKKEYNNDAKFVKDIERALPKGAMVFMLPYLQFPETPTPPYKISNFEYFKLYLHSRNLRWSYGAVNGRSLASWQKRVSDLPIEKLISEIKQAGFQAICVMRKGYEDHGSKIEKILHFYRSSDSIVSPDGTMILFPI